MSSGRGGRSSFAVDSVGSLLAAIANLIAEGLRILSFSDKRQWGEDEHEQVRALEEVLDEARKDFQELGPLLNGQLHYETDRTRELLPISSTSTMSPPAMTSLETTATPFLPQ